MNKQFQDFFDKTNQIHVILSVALLCVVFTFVAPDSVNYIFKPIIIVILSYILYKNFIETRNFSKFKGTDKDTGKDTLREMKSNILASYILCVFMLVLLLYVVYTTVN